MKGFGQTFGDSPCTCLQQWLTVDFSCYVFQHIHCWSLQTNFNLKRWKKCLMALCWYQMLGLFQYRLTDSSSYKLFLSKGPDIPRVQVLFKPVQCLFCPLSRPNFWKLCNLIQKHLSLPSQNRKVALETSAAVNQVILLIGESCSEETFTENTRRTFYPNALPTLPAWQIQPAPPNPFSTLFHHVLPYRSKSHHCSSSCWEEAMNFCGPLFWECFSVTWGNGLETETWHNTLIKISKQQWVYYGCPFYGILDLPGPESWMDETSLCPALWPVGNLHLSLNRAGWGLCYLHSKMS